MIIIKKNTKLLSNIYCYKWFPNNIKYKRDFILFLIANIVIQYSFYFKQIFNIEMQYAFLQYFILFNANNVEDKTIYIKV